MGWYEAVFDIETDIVDNKTLAELGPMGIGEIKVFYAVTWHTDLPCIRTWSWSKPVDPESSEDFCHFLRDFLDNSNMDARLIGHNILRFDIPVIKRLTDIDIHTYPNIKVIDTLILSKLYYSERESHSLESWASTLGGVKESLSDLLLRCVSDVDLTEKLYNKFKSTEIVSHASELEHAVAKLVAEQVEAGVAFNSLAAEELVLKITHRMAEIQKEVDDQGITCVIPASQLVFPPSKQFKKDGSPSAAMLNFLSKHPKWSLYWSILENKYYIENSGVTHWLPLNTSVPLEISRKLDLDRLDDVKSALSEHGWKPTLWNVKKDAKGRVIKPIVRTSPKLTDENKKLCPDLERLAEKYTWVQRLTEYLSLRNRQSVLCSEKGTGWLNNERLKIDGCLSPDADSVGTRTFRFRHKIVANVPRPTSLLGKEMRSLFIPRSTNRKFVGWDAAALEARIEAHYTYPYDGGAYAKELLEGDIHTKNMKALDLPSRDKAKTFKYAVTYGAMTGKLMSTFGWTERDAAYRYNAFWETNEPLSEVKRAVEKQYDELGYLIGLDGRKLHVESRHTCLNTLFQSAGAILMKYAMVLADRMIKRECLDAIGVIRYHDEEQWDVLDIHAERVAEIGRKSIILAGKYLKLNIPMDAECKIGYNWAETH